MRTTLTLDADVAARVKDRCRRTGHSVEDTVNDLLRLGLSADDDEPARRPFRVKARPLGALPGVDLDDTAGSSSGSKARGTSDRGRRELAVARVRHSVAPR